MTESGRTRAPGGARAPRVRASRVAVSLTREAASLAVTASAWPFGFVDQGVAEVRRLARRAEGVVAAPVLLIHGFAANKSNWMVIRRHLGAAGFGRVHCVNYNPFRHGVEAISAQISARARALMAATGADHVHLVGHSMGGFVARYAVQLGGLEEARTVVSIASPHQGVPLAALLPTRIRLTGGIAELASGSPTVLRLAASSRPMATEFVAFYSDFDLLVPGHRGRLDAPALQPTNILVPDEGHLSIVLSRRVAAAIVDQLSIAEGLPGFGSLPGSLPGSRPDRDGSGKNIPEDSIDRPA